ncbi:MAG: carboxypeptidase-like regulatory domain-containing protein [Flavobacteriaceae bacterium]|nr:carboxypeptidase-like regulatory domain-containing protein [Flavobacteriaceae bacterium]
MKNQRSKKGSYLAGIALVCLMMFSVTTAQAQEVTTDTSFVVKGIVSDEDGPLAGANVILKGSSVGTITDMDGHFEFPQKLKKGDILIFSYVGLETQYVTIENQNSASNITLKLDTTLEEIIVVGAVANKKVYSSKKKKDN